MAKPRRSDLTGYSREARSVDRTVKNEKYTEWDDTTSDTHDFDKGLDFAKERGDAQKQFVREQTNTDELMSEITRNRSYVEAFRNWARGMFMRGHQYGRFSDMDSDRQEWTRIYDRFLDRTVNREGFVVRRLATAELLLGRGNRMPTSLEQLQGMKGQYVTSKGSMSTSMAKHGLTIGALDKRIEYEIMIPANSQGAGMWIGDRRINGWGARQREYMTNRDSTYQVGDTRYDSRRKVYVTQLVYVGHEKHSYD